MYLLIILGLLVREGDNSEGVKNRQGGMLPVDLRKLRHQHLSIDMRQTIRFSLMFTNFTFMGLPIVSELYGPEAVFNYVIFTLPVRIVFYGGALNRFLQKD